MTRDRINGYIQMVPQFLKEGYGIEPLYDLSKDRHETIEYDGMEYEYYPDIPGVLVGSKLVLWETGKEDVCDVDIHNAAHIDEIISRGRHLQYDDDIVAVVDISRKGRLNVHFYNKQYTPVKYPKSVKFDNIMVFYNSDDVDLEKNGPMKALVRAIFLIKRYRREYIIPYKNQEPCEWGMYD